MKDSSEKLQQLYFQLLENEFDYPIYDVVPETKQYPYYTLDSFLGREDNTKDEYGMEVEAQVSAWSLGGGKKQTNTMGNDLIEFLRDRSAPINFGDTYNIYVTTVSLVETIEQETDNGMLYRRIVRFNHKIQQLT